jgi:hypothetical protein
VWRVTSDPPRHHVLIEICCVDSDSHGGRGIFEGPSRLGSEQDSSHHNYWLIRILTRWCGQYQPPRPLSSALPTNSQSTSRHRGLANDLSRTCTFIGVLSPSFVDTSVITPGLSYLRAKNAGACSLQQALKNACTHLIMADRTANTQTLPHSYLRIDPQYKIVYGYVLPVHILPFVYRVQPKQ